MRLIDVPAYMLILHEADLHIYLKQKQNTSQIIDQPFWS